MSQTVRATNELETTRPNGKLAAVMRAARKSSGLSQVDAARLIGISQGSLSKMENGLLVPDIFVWLRFASLTDIPERSCLCGYVDWRQPLRKLSLSDRAQVGRYKLPARYATEQGSSARKVNSVLAFARANLTPKQNQDFDKRLGVDTDYFLDLRNQIGFQYFVDAVSLLSSAGALDERALDGFSAAFTRDECHGNLLETYRGLKEPAEVLQVFAKNFGAYSCDYDLSLEEVGRARPVEITLKPRPHLARVEANAATLAVVPRIWERSLEGLIQAHSGARLKAKASPIRNFTETCHIQLGPG